MTQRLHLVFGGELVSPRRTSSRTCRNIHIVGMFPDYASAFAAWKAEAQRTVDNAHMRYFIAHIHRLRDEAQGRLGDRGTGLIHGRLAEGRTLYNLGRRPRAGQGAWPAAPA
jgi:hypothetical protein